MKKKRRNSRLSQTQDLNFERCEPRKLLAVAPPSGELTEGNANQWEAFADGSTATVSNDTLFVRQGGQSLKLNTQGGFDTGIRYRAPAGNWDFSQIDFVSFWVYGNNTTPYVWQGDQPVIKLISPSGSLVLTPNQQMMPNFSWAELTVPLNGDSIWQRTTQGNFDLGNITTFEIHQDTWDYGFISYYDGLRFSRAIDLPKLSEPKGIVIDSSGRTFAVEAAGSRIRVFDSSGNGVQMIGAPGSTDGRLASPTDVAIGTANRVYVSDTGNHRIQVFDSAGAFVSKFGAFGTAAGSFSSPEGIAIDSAGRVYVADAGNHRVQRFLASGAVDPTWGSGGVVGATGLVKRDNTGFDSPSDIAIHPGNGQIYVADRGNQRIQVYSSSGQYVRTYLGIYQPRALAFDQQGNLYIAGDDPNDSYTGYDGRLRVLRSGDELVGRHYTGGADDLGRRLNGVALRADGRVVIADTFNGRLVQTDAALNTPIKNIAVKALGNEVTITWDSLHAGPSRISFGGRIYSSAGVHRNHAVKVAGLTPHTRASYSIAFTDSYSGSERWTTEEFVSTGAPRGQTEFLRVKAVGLVYTDATGGTGYTRRAQTEIDAMRNRFDTVANYYWRNSGAKLWLDFTVREVNVDISNGVDLFTRMQPDLSSLGYSAADDFDAVYSVSPFASGNFGGSRTVFNRTVAAAIWTTQTDFVAIHEVNHTVDSMYHVSGLRKYEFNHGIWAVTNSLGHDFAVNGQILRNMLPANYGATVSPFSKRFAAPDADEDGLPDSSPTGLTKPLSITETSFGSSSSNPDTDNDGLGDLAEATTLTNAAGNPTLSDSDSDGLQDGVDPNPLYPISNVIRRGTPTINGTFSSSEGWTTLTQNWGFSNTSLVSDTNLNQALTATYAAWDDLYLYFALVGPANQTQLRLDGDADNWFMGSSNYEINLRNDVSSLGLRVNAGTPDLFRQIDNDGQYSEFFDTDPQFTRPYNGRPIFNQPAEGLGFSGRLATESQLTYQIGGSGNQRVWELRIPWSNRTLLQGRNGKEIAVDFNLGGDRLFETDHFARFRLVNTAIEAPIVTFEGTFAYLENDPPTFIAQHSSIVDFDSFDLQNGQLRINLANPDPADELSFQNAGLERGQIGITGSNVFYGGKLIGTLSGGSGATPLLVNLNQSATAQAVESLLRRLSFRSVGNDVTPGIRQVNVTLADGDGGISPVRSVTVQVQAVNQPPTLNSINNFVIDEDASLQTINLSGITAGTGESQPLQVTASSGNLSLIANPTVNYNSPNSTGALSFAPLANQFGVAQITVTVVDGGPDRNLATTSDNGSISRVFTVTVNPVNDQPTLNVLVDLSINQDAAPQSVELRGITAGGGESQAMRVSATSSNPGLIPNPTINYSSPSDSGMLNFAALSGKAGSAVLTVSVEDAGLDGNLNTTADNAIFSRTFTVTVIPDPDIAVSSPVGPIGELNNGTKLVFFNVSLSAASTKTISVDYATTIAGYASAATPTNDFIPVSGRLDFAPGETSKSVGVFVRGDQLVELDELFGLMLNNPANGRILDELADLVITDDDLWSYPSSVDFGTELSPVQGGGIGVGTLPFAASKGLGWTSGISNLQIVDRGVGSAALRDLVLTTNSAFGFVVPNGNYFARITFGDAAIAHDSMRVKLEGAAKPIVNTQANEFLTRIYAVNVSDGRLDLEFEDLGGADPHVAITGIAFGRR